VTGFSSGESTANLKTTSTFRCRVARPELVYIASYPSDTVGILRSVGELGLNTKMLGGGLAGSQAAAIKMQLGEAANGVVNVDLWEPVPPYPAQRPSWNYRKATGGGLILDMFAHWRYIFDRLLGEIKSVSCRHMTAPPECRRRVPAASDRRWCSAVCIGCGPNWSPRSSF
jgi:hypothetical protein